jgi:hypothetical protein
MEHAGANSGSSKWLIESLRVTTFLSPLVNFDPSTWWINVTGGPPETRTSKPVRGEFVDAGEFLGQYLQLAIQPGRVDWSLTPRVSEVDIDDTRLRSLGEFPRAIGPFVSVMKSWLPSSVGVVRLAYGVVLLKEVKDSAAGYEHLAGFLPAIKLDNRSSDFMYQINRPRILASGTLINRLTKWSVVAFQKVRLSFPVSGPPITGPATLYSPSDAVKWASRLEIDVSTAATQVEMDASQLPNVLDNLEVAAREIAVTGDIS